MKPKQVVILQWVFEWAIPLIGLFYWKWDVTFILLFFSLDWLAASVMSFLKVKKRDEFTVKTEFLPQRWLWLFFPLLAHVLAYVLLPLLLQTNQPEYSFVTRFLDFLMEKEMGIPQSVLLIPLVAYMAYFQYKQEFLLPKRFRVVTVRSILSANFKNSIFVLAAIAGFALVTSFGVHLADVVLAYVVIGLIALARFPFYLIRQHKQQ